MTRVNTLGALGLRRRSTPTGSAAWDPLAASFDVAFAAAPFGMALVALDGRVLRANRALAELLGQPEIDLTGLGMVDLVHADDTAEQVLQVQRLLRGELSGTSLALRLRRLDGEDEPVSMHLSIVRDAAETPRHFVVQISGQGERNRLQERVRFEAEHDSLTGLLNRHAFGRAIDRHAAYDKRYGRGGALIVVDVDGFGEVNGALGTVVGDEVLRGVGAVMSARLRETDSIARLDGDAFGVLVPEVDATDARRIAEELLASIAARELHAGFGGPVRVTASAGVACFGAGAAEDLFAEAEMALREAKAIPGRGRALVFDTALRVRRHDLTRRRSWAEKLRHALATDAFVLDAQPVVAAGDGAVDHHELLLRMVDDDGSLVRPNGFLHIAERFGLMPAIDEWVVRQAIGMVAPRAGTQAALTVAVNVGRESVEDGRLLPNVLAMLAESPEAGPHLIFELTDRGDIDAAKRFMARLGEYGCRFSLDDFGAGTASFYYLKHLPFDFVKLDGEFTRGLPDSAADQAIVRAIVQASRALGRRVVAECVEDEEILEAVRAFDVDLAQGLRLGRPARASESLAPV